MTMTFQTEALADFLPEAAPLLERHWQEVGSCPHSHALLVNVPLYQAIEGSGALHITTARFAGRLVGYAVYFVQDYAHVQGLCMAQSDALYLAPEWRKGFAGLRLLQAAERALKDRGVHTINQICTYKKDFGKMLARMGYHPAECTYKKEL